MSLFRDLGERVERFKQDVTTAAEDEAEYVCRDCETLIYTSQEACPECGSENIARRKVKSDESDEPDEPDEPKSDGEETTPADESDGTEGQSK